MAFCIKGVNMERIEFSLSKGRLFRKSDFVLATILFVAGILLILGLILSFFLDLSNYERICVIFGGCVLSIPSFALSLSQLFHQKKLRKMINIWIDDALELDARVIYGGSINYGLSGTRPLIVVKFSYQDKIYEKKSFDGKKKSDIILNKYINKKIKILYSPTYDEVLILKDDKISLT